MRKLKMAIELEYDNRIIHADDDEGRTWFLNSVLGDVNGLSLFSDEIGDNIGTVRVLSIPEEMSCT